MTVGDRLDLTPSSHSLFGERGYAGKVQGDGEGQGEREGVMGLE